LTFLLTWLWQGLAIAGVTAVVVACAPRLSAATRHAIWWVSCAGVLGLPAAYLLLEPGSSSVVPPARVAVPSTPDTLVPSLLLAWGLFAAAALVRIGASIVAVYRLKRSGVEADPLLASRLRRSRAAHLLAHVRVSDGINGACALGLGRPIILLSRSLVTQLDDEALAAIVLHEHAHLDRHDDWWQLFQAIVGACAAWHPAVWLIGRQIAIEREAACDDRVLGRASDAREYARALLRAAEFRQVWAPERRLEIPGAAVSMSMLRLRVRRLLDARMHRASGPALPTRALAAFAMTMIVAAGARIPTMIVFDDVGALLPGVEHAWFARVAGAALPAAVRPTVRRPAYLQLRAAQLPTAGVLATEPTPAVPQVAIVGEPLALAGDVSVVVPEAPVSSPASRTAREDIGAASGVALSSAPRASRAAPPDTSPPRGPWITLGRSASAGGVSIGRFFTRAAKGIAGSF
jgi:beta-lactamase regulating signal transducer with metallopeptidase domain